MICKVPIQKDLLRGFDPIPNKDLIALETANEAAYLTSDTFLSKILKRGDIQRTQWFKNKKDSNARLKDLKSSFSAPPQRGTQYVIVQMSTRDKGEAKEVLDIILQQYRTDRSSQAESQLTKDLAALKRERDKIKTEITQKRTMLNSMRKQMLEREQMLRQQYRIMKEQSLDKQIESLRYQHKVVLTKFQEISTRQKDLDQKRAQYEDVLREIEDITSTLLRFEDRIYAIDVARDNARKEQAQIIPGTVPHTISFPRYDIFDPVGIFVRLLLSLAQVEDDRSQSNLVLERAYKLSPGDADVMDTYAGTLIRRNTRESYEKAEGILRESIKQKDRAGVAIPPGLYVHLGQALLGLGCHSEAGEQLDKAEERLRAGNVLEDVEALKVKIREARAKLNQLR